MFADIPPLLWVHFIASLIALPLGLWQLVAAKGTSRHRLVGRIYVPVMLVCLLSALATYRPGTQFLFFYILALVGLWALWDGMRNLRRWLRDGGAATLRNHKISMGYSWLGLFMAAVSQFLVNPRFGINDFALGWRYWAVFAFINILIYTAGSWWIFKRLVPDARDSSTS